MVQFRFAKLVMLAAFALAPLAAAAEPVAITLRNNGEVVRMARAQTLVVNLPVDRSLEQSWAISVPPSAPLSLVADSLDAQEAGGVALQRLEFAPTGAGRGKLALSVVEPFTRGRGQRLFYEVTVEVK